MTKEEIEQAAKDNWDSINGQFINGLNPHAHNIGFIEGAKYAESENERLKAEREWISVEDRLPEKDGNNQIMCLVFDTYNGIVTRPYNEYHKCWDDEDCDDFYCPASGGNITHWMPLPQPPKQSCPQCKTEYTKEELLTNEHCFKCGFEMKGF